MVAPTANATESSSEPAPPACTAPNRGWLERIAHCVRTIAPRCPGPYLGPQYVGPGPRLLGTMRGHEPTLSPSAASTTLRFTAQSPHRVWRPYPTVDEIGIIHAIHG